MMEQSIPSGVSLKNWTKALALRPAHITREAWEAACVSGAEQERRKAVLVERRREALGLVCYLAGADEWSDRWCDLPEALREEYRAIACDTYAVSAISWSPPLKNIVIEYTTDEDMYRAAAQPERQLRPAVVPVSAGISALRRMAGRRA